MKPNWQIIESSYPARDTFVAPFSVKDFGAKGDGKSDDTKAFQIGLDHTRDIGGGSLYVPAGKYVIRGQLIIPTGVTLRGIWQNPSLNNGKAIGSILMLYHGHGKDDIDPAIGLLECSGIREITLWYPEQKAEKIIPYPFSIKQIVGDNATIENVFLVNSYQGIQIGPGSNELHFIRNVYGTPLKLGIWLDSTTDIGRLDSIHFNSDFWSNSRLPNAPKKNGLHAKWIKENGIGLHMGRSDWEYGTFVKIENYHIGLEIDKGERGAPNAQFYGFEFYDCEIGIKISDTNPIGLAFTRCTIHASKQAIHLEPDFQFMIMLNNCNISAPELLLHEGSGSASFQSCTFTGNLFIVKKGTITIADSQSTMSLNIQAKEDIIAGVLVDNHIKFQLTGPGAERIKECDAKNLFHPLPPFPKLTSPRLKPINQNLIVLHPEDDDSTRMIQNALDKVAADGGGTVFLTGGDYMIHGNLVIPTGTELKGVYDVPHHTRGGGSVLHIYTNKGKESGTPAILMQTEGGLSGVSFYYPEQDFNNIELYPFTIKGDGANIYLLNISAANPYQFLDLKSNCCDNHYVDYIAGSPLKTGVQVGGGSKNGLIANTHFNPHFWVRTPEKQIYSNKPKDKEWTMLWNYQKENLDAFLFGHCINQVHYQSFVFRALYGIHFVPEGMDAFEGGFILGQGVDSCVIGTFFETAAVKGLHLVNTELVCMSTKNTEYIRCSKDVKGTIVFHNTMLSGRPHRGCTLEEGHLVLQQGTVTRVGRSFEINEGEFSLFNFNFLTKPRRGGHLIIKNDNSKINIASNNFFGPFTINGKSIKDGTMTKNIEIYANITRSDEVKVKTPVYSNEDFYII